MNLNKIYDDIVSNEWSDHWIMVSNIVHWMSHPDYLKVLSAGEFLVEDNKWQFQLPKMKEVDHADGMIHVHTRLLNKGTIDWDDVTEEDIVLDPQNIEDMKKFLALISLEIKIRNDWSLVYERVAS